MSASRSILLIIGGGIAAYKCLELIRRLKYRGIATRAFERRFALADHVRVTGAAHEHGMLHIDLVREMPEALKPRRIEIGRPTQATAIEAKPVETAEV